jgi:hypothetical protein
MEGARSMERRRGRPEAQGLYDPAHEHDACGVGFVAQIDGTRSHALVHQGIQVLVRLEHRGACGCDPETGDGAGILIQLPDAFLRKEAAQLGIELPPVGAYASGMVFLAQRGRRARVAAHRVRADRRRLRATLPRLAHRAGPRRADRPHRARGDAGDRAGIRRRGARPRSGRLRAQALRDPADVRERRLDAARVLLRAEPVEPDLRLRRHADVLADRVVLPGPHRSGGGLGAGARALALQHEHLPDLGSRPSVPLHGAQRRDQHAARQRSYMRAREGTMRAPLFGEDLAKLYPIMRPTAPTRRSSTTCSSSSR